MKDWNSIFRTILVLIFWLFCLELTSYLVLRIIGINPLAYRSPYVYGREISGYYVCKNAGNFSFLCFDGLNNFEPVKQETDDNGFLTDVQLQKEKPKDVYRIFIMGGSTAWGSIETRLLTHDSTYPVGTYSYNSSITGILKTKLQKDFPGRKFEVINAAVIKHSFLQNWLQYLAEIHYYKPDLIINIDGFNDLANIATNKNIFANTEKEVDEFLESDHRNRQRSWPFSLLLINHLLEKHPKTRFERPNEQWGANVDLTKKYSQQYYDRVKGGFIENSSQIAWCIASFEKQLQLDSVKSIFCLQPMLSRRLYQKQLSPLEMKLRANVEPDSTVSMILLEEQFIDDYFSSKIDSLVTSYGADFVDFNKQITQLGGNTEFYVDYCHLTPFGNEFVAATLKQKVSKYLR